MKLGNIYDLESFKRFKDSANAQSGFKDSEAGTILARSLTAINPRVFEKKFPELTFVNSGIQTDNTGGYSRRIQSLRLQEQGGFTTSGDKSKNKGKISLAGEDSFLAVIEREAESDWSNSEIKEAELGNVNLPERYIKAHNGIYMREVDEIGLVGNPAGNIMAGLLNYAGFTADSASGAIGTLSAQQMYDEFAELINAQHDQVNNTPEYMAARVTMPTSVMNVLASTILNSAAGSSSVLKALQDNFPGIQFVSTFRAEDVGGTSVVAAHSVNEESMVFRVPIPLTIGEIIKASSFTFHVESMYRIAGLDVLEDASARLLTGL